MPLPPELLRVPLPHLMAPPDAARRFRLLEVVRRRLRERRYSSRTEEAYVAWIRRYVIFNDRRHPRDLGADDIRLATVSSFAHVAEYLALTRIAAQIDKSIAEMFDPDYLQLLAAARARVAGTYEGEYPGPKLDAPDV